jgi:hypothetical protein
MFIGRKFLESKTHRRVAFNASTAVRNAHQGIEAGAPEPEHLIKSIGRCRYTKRQAEAAHLPKTAQEISLPWR